MCVYQNRDWRKTQLILYVRAYIHIISEVQLTNWNRIGRAQAHSIKGIDNAIAPAPDHSSNEDWLGTEWVCHVYLLVCKPEPEHPISVKLQRLHTFEQEDVANVHLHMTTHIVSVEENRVSDVAAGHLCSTLYRQYKQTHTYVHSISRQALSLKMCMWNNLSHFHSGTHQTLNGHSANLHTHTQQVAEKLTQTWAHIRVYMRNVTFHNTNILHNRPIHVRGKKTCDPITCLFTSDMYGSTNQPANLPHQTQTHVIYWVDNMRLCLVGEVGFYHSTVLSKNMHD